MKIRSVTTFMPLSATPDERQLAQLGELAADASAMLEEGGFEVQSTRLASSPFSEVVEGMGQKQAVQLAQDVEGLALEAGFGYLSLGPAMAEHPNSFAYIPAILGATKATFLSGALTSSEKAIVPEAIGRSAETIRALSTLEANGFANLRYAALANVPAGSPFFPAAYHAGEGVSFAFATQAADLAVQAASSAKSVDELSGNLTQEIEAQANQLTEIAGALSKRHLVHFSGIDFSLAPFPEESDSLGHALEQLGVPRAGLSGSLTAAAILTAAIQAASFPRAGFNGLLLPPLEDAVLAKRAAEGVLSVNDLLLYSAVCGTGLDTIPLPGDASVEALSALLMDLAALAVRLDKPLTARLMPIPGKDVGDETDFDFAYFANSRVMALEAEGLKPPLGDSSPFTIQASGE